MLVWFVHQNSLKLICNWTCLSVCLFALCLFACFCFVGYIIAIIYSYLPGVSSSFSGPCAAINCVVVEKGAISENDKQI
jgi:hypothetical protein